jgi:serpin B
MLELDRRSVLGGALGLLALGAVPALAGCSRGPEEVTPVTPVELAPLAFHAARDRVSVADAPHLDAVVAGMRDFARDLHRASATAEDNWTASPVSIAMAFGMLRAGARGATASQLDAVFEWPAGDPAGSPHRALNALTADLVTTGPVATGPAPSPSDGRPADPIVAVANGLFLDGGFAPAVEQDFLKLLATQYGAEATAVSFADPAAAATINGWVQEHTRGRIDKLFDRLDPSTLLVLANAVYLKTTWASQFDRASTTDGTFTTTDGSVTAPLMHQRLEPATYDESADWQRVRLPYVGGELAMRVVVPRGVVRDLPTLTQLLPFAMEQRVKGHAIVDLTLPSWDTATTIPLLGPMAALGATDLDDLRGIAAGDLGVSDAVHRANVTVDEEGTEAAAVTGIAVATSAIVGTPVQVTADRPFVWAVVHEPTGTPVFTGHVTDPTA